MSLMLLSAPVSEPVTLAEIKAHLRIAHPDEDALISSLSVAARQAVEVRGQLALIAQQWRFSFDALKDTIIELPVAPVISIDGVNVVDDAGVAQTVNPGLYESVVGAVGRVKALGPWPAPGRKIDGIQIDFTAGYGDAASTPDDLKQAVKYIAAHFYENRERAQTDRVFSVPDVADALIAPYRRIKL